MQLESMMKMLGPVLTSIGVDANAITLAVNGCVNAVNGFHTRLTKLEQLQAEDRLTLREIHAAIVPNSRYATEHKGLPERTA